MKTLVFFAIVVLITSSASALAMNNNDDITTNPQQKLSFQGIMDNNNTNNTGQYNQSNTNQTNGTSQQVQENQQTLNEGNETNLRIQVRAETPEELGQMIQQRQQEMNQEIQSLGAGTVNAQVYQNQNKVRLAVHAMFAMENLTGGIGQNVSKIANEFNNSVNKTIQAEEKIRSRDMFTRFFFGGDEVAAGELERELAQNQVRIAELNRLREQCECVEEVKNILQEQIQNLEQEQNRLQQLAQEEKSNKGLFGWLWK